MIEGDAVGQAVTETRRAGTLLLVAFILGKSFGFGDIAEWSWWWVFSPIWIPLAIVVVGAFVFGLGAALGKATKKKSVPPTLEELEEIRQQFRDSHQDPRAH